MTNSKTKQNTLDFSPLSTAHKLKENSEPKIMGSPLSDKVNTMRKCECENCTYEHQHTLQEILQTTTHQATNQKVSPEKKVRDMTMQDSRKSPHTMINADRHSEYFLKCEDEGDKESTRSNKKQAMKEYGFEKRISEQATPEQPCNDSREDFFTKKDPDSNSKSKDVTENFNNSQISPISKILDENSSESDSISEPRRVVTVDTDKLSKNNIITKVEKSKNSKVKTIEKFDVHVIKTTTSKSKKEKVKTVKHESHSSHVNSEYLKVFGFQGNNKFLKRETMQRMKELNIDLKKHSIFSSKNKKLNKKKLKKSKRSPVHIRNYKNILPNIKRKNRARSPMIFEFYSRREALKSKKTQLDKNKKRRRSTETKYSTTQSQSRKKSPYQKKSPPRFNFKRRNKAKSPKIIVPPAVECDLGKLSRDTSMVVMLRLNFKCSN